MEIAQAGSHLFWPTRSYCLVLFVSSLAYLYALLFTEQRVTMH